MKKIALIHTGFALVEELNKLFKQQLGDIELINIIDDSLLREVIKEGKVTASVRKRMLHYFLAAEEYNVDCIFNVCSSVGEVTDLARLIVKTPIIKIDEKMAQEAVEQSSNIGVVATLQTTLDPTCRLIKKKAAEKGKKLKVQTTMCYGAFEELMKGNKEKHDEIVLNAIKSLENKVEVIVLAQGSMARLIPKLDKRLISKVLTSTLGGVNEVKDMLHL